MNTVQTTAGFRLSIVLILLGLSSGGCSANKLEAQNKAAGERPAGQTSVLVDQKDTCNCVEIGF